MLLLFSLYSSFVLTEFTEQLIVRRDLITTASFRVSAPTVADGEIPFYADFPPALGIALDEFGVSAFRLTLTRGRLEEETQGPPPGAVLRVTFDGRFEKPISFKRLTQAISGFAGPITIDGELAETTPISPVDVSHRERVLHVPHVNICTGNLQSLLDLLPCGTAAGLGLRLIHNWKFLAQSGYLSLDISAKKTESQYAMKLSVSHAGDLPEIPHRLATCPFPGQAVREASDNETRVVSKKIRGLHLTHATLVYRIESRDEDLQLVDFFPFFFTPLFHTLRGDCKFEWQVDKAEPHRRAGRTIRARIRAGSRCQLEVDVVKNFVHISDLSYSVDKGFEVSGAAWKLADKNEWAVSNAVLVHLPLQDGSMVFNAVAIATTVLFYFYGKLVRVFSANKQTILQKILAKIGFSS